MSKKTRVVVIANNKGGVGKSLISQLIATYLAYKRNLKVLALDFDPQGNMSHRFLKDDRVRDMSNYQPPLHPDFDPSNPEDDDWSGKSSALHMWTGQPVVPYPTELENLDVLPSDASLIKSIENFEFTDSVEAIIERPYAFFNLPEFFDCGYDVVIVDTPPAKGPLTSAAIRAATHVLLPIELSNKSLQGLSGMIDLIMRQNHYRPANNQTVNLGLFMNKVSYTKRLPQQRVVDTIERNPILKNLLLKDLVLHDSPRAIDIDEDQAPLTAPWTELKDGDRFADESSALGEYIYHSLGFSKSLASNDSQKIKEVV